jgi:nucleoid DNA-binding protein
MGVKVKTKEVVARVSERMSCYKKDCRELLDHFADLVVEELAAGRAVYFKPLGTFHVVPSRGGKRRVRFFPARRLRLILAGKGGGEAAVNEAGG